MTEGVEVFLLVLFFLLSVTLNAAFYPTSMIDSRVYERGRLSQSAPVSSSMASMMGSQDCEGKVQEICSVKHVEAMFADLDRLLRERPVAEECVLAEEDSVDMFDGMPPQGLGDRWRLLSLDLFPGASVFQGKKFADEVEVTLQQVRSQEAALLDDKATLALSVISNIITNGVNAYYTQANLDFQRVNREEAQRLGENVFAEKVQKIEERCRGEIDDWHIWLQHKYEEEGRQADIEMCKVFAAIETETNEKIRESQQRVSDCERKTQEDLRKKILVIQEKKKLQQEILAKEHKDFVKKKEKECKKSHAHNKEKAMLSLKEDYDQKKDMLEETFLSDMKNAEREAENQLLSAKKAHKKEEENVRAWQQKEEDKAREQKNIAVDLAASARDKAIACYENEVAEKKSKWIAELKAQQAANEKKILEDTWAIVRAKELQIKQEQESKLSVWSERCSLISMIIAREGDAFAPLLVYYMLQKYNDDSGNFDSMDVSNWQVSTIFSELHAMRYKNPQIDLLIFASTNINDVHKGILRERGYWILELFDTMNVEEALQTIVPKESLSVPARMRLYEQQNIRYRSERWGVEYFFQGNFLKEIYKGIQESGSCGKRDIERAKRDLMLRFCLQNNNEVFATIMAQDAETQSVFLAALKEHDLWSELLFNGKRLTCYRDRWEMTGYASDVVTINILREETAQESERSTYNNKVLHAWPYPYESSLSFVFANPTKDERVAHLFLTGGLLWSLSNPWASEYQTVLSVSGYALDINQCNTMIENAPLDLLLYNRVDEEILAHLMTSSADTKTLDDVRYVEMMQKIKQNTVQLKRIKILKYILDIFGKKGVSFCGGKGLSPLELQQMVKDPKSYLHPIGMLLDLLSQSDNYFVNFDMDMGVRLYILQNSGKVVSNLYPHTLSNVRHALQSRKIRVEDIVHFEQDSDWHNFMCDLMPEVQCQLHAIIAQQQWAVNEDPIWATCLARLAESFLLAEVEKVGVLLMKKNPMDFTREDASIMSLFDLQCVQLSKSMCAVGMSDSHDSIETPYGPMTARGLWHLQQNIMKCTWTHFSKDPSLKRFCFLNNLLIIQKGFKDASDMAYNTFMERVLENVLLTSFVCTKEEKEKYFWNHGKILLTVASPIDVELDQAVSLYKGFHERMQQLKEYVDKQSDSILLEERRARILYSEWLGDYKDSSQSLSLNNVLFRYLGYLKILFRPTSAIQNYHVNDIQNEIEGDGLQRLMRTGLGEGLITSEGLQELLMLKPFTHEEELLLGNVRSAVQSYLPEIFRLKTIPALVLVQCLAKRQKEAKDIQELCVGRMRSVIIRLMCLLKDSDFIEQWEDVQRRPLLESMSAYLGLTDIRIIAAVVSLKDGERVCSLPDEHPHYTAFLMQQYERIRKDHTTYEDVRIAGMTEEEEEQEEARLRRERLLKEQKQLQRNKLLRPKSADVGMMPKEAHTRMRRFSLQGEGSSSVLPKITSKMGLKGRGSFRMHFKKSKSENTHKNSVVEALLEEEQEGASAISSSF